MATITNTPAHGAETSNTTGTTTHTPARRNRLWGYSVVLAVIGTLVSAYLAYAKITNTETVCIQGLSNCTAVQNSVYSYLLGIPVAYLGIAGYLAILGVLLLEKRVPFFAARGRILMMGLTLGGFLFSAYLTAIEAFVLREWCQWCVISALTMTALFGVSFVRLWQSIGAGEPDIEPETEG